MAKLVSKTYGDALFEVAVEKKAVDDMMSEALAVLDILEKNRELMVLLTTPKIASDEKKQILEDVFKGRVSDELMGLFVMLLEKSHISEVSDVLIYFSDRCREYKHIGKALVSSAMALTDKEKSEIEKKLIATTDYQTFEIEYTVDPELIGGVVIRIGDRVVDGSLKHRLDALTRELQGIQL